MAAEKKTQDIKVHMSEPLELELRRLADLDNRKLSEYIELTLRRHVFGHLARPFAEEEGSLRGDEGRIGAMRGE